MRKGNRQIIRERICRALFLHLPQPAARSIARMGKTTPLQMLHKLGRILPDDIYIASYPRSGNTWTRYIIATLILGTDTTPDGDTVSRIAPDIYRSIDLINRLDSRRIIKIHEPVLNDCPRIIYVHRDYRESLVSYWHYRKRLNNYPGTFSQFIRSRMPRIHGSWKQHMQAMNRRATLDPSTIHIVRYADLRLHFVETVSRLVEWSGIGMGVDLHEVEKRTSLESMANSDNNSATPISFASGESFFVDRGKGSDWRHDWSDKDLEWLARDQELVAIMNQLGYV